MRATNKDRIIVLPAVYDVADPYFCVWLQEMADKGWIYEDRGIVFLTFRRETPQRRRYRVLDKSIYDAGAEELELYESSGWQAEESLRNFMLFSTADEKAPEFFNDKESFTKSVRGRKRLSILFLIYCLTVIWIRIGSLSPFSSINRNDDVIGRIHALSYSAAGTFWWQLVVTILFALAFLAIIMKEGKRIKKYSNLDNSVYDTSYDNPKYVRAKRLSAFVYVDLVLVLLVIFQLFISIYISDEVRTGSYALSYDGEHPLRYEEFDPDAWNNAKQYIYVPGAKQSEYVTGYSAGSAGADYVFCEDYEEFCNLEELSSDEEYTYPIAVFNSYYKVARKEEWAEEYLGEEIAIDKTEEAGGPDVWKEALEEIRFDCDGVDYAGYTVYEEKNGNELYKMQHLYLRKGNAIQIINYVGDLNLKDKVSIFVDEFSKGSSE